MTVSRKRAASNMGLETPAADSSIGTDNVGLLSRKIRRCDSSADAASLLLLLSKQSAGESTSQGSSPLKQQARPKHHLEMENFPALLPPPKFDTIHFMDQGNNEVQDNIKLKPLDVCILNYSNHTRGASLKERRQPHKTVIGRPMAPAPRLPRIPAGDAFETSH
mmetsp:Transcript_133192/g.198134  ORF Transcript_133192/g.198134 Transcript_133192/m.198134 type:complete len:164 (+) Transcript_133192:161-652(+)